MQKRNKRMSNGKKLKNKKVNIVWNAESCDKLIGKTSCFDDITYNIYIST